jgi:hypothetical protein
MRAELHERFAAWLERAMPERAGEYEEILGFHHEQAYRQRVELGETEPAVQEIAARAALLLAAAGRRAIGRGDMLGAVQLLRRAVALVPDPDPAWLLDLGELEIWTGENATAGFELLRAARGRAESRGHAGVAALAAVLYATFAAGDRFARRFVPSGDREIREIYALRTIRPRGEIATRLATIIGPAEELFWRGLIQDGLAARFGRWRGAAAAAGAYGAAHVVTGNATLVGAATTAGAYWSALRATGMPIGALVVSHVVWDVWIFLVQPTA